MKTHNRQVRLRGEKRKMFEHSELLLAARRTKLTVKRGEKGAEGGKYEAEGGWQGKRGTGVERDRN